MQIKLAYFDRRLIGVEKYVKYYEMNDGSTLTEFSS